MALAAPEGVLGRGAAAVAAGAAAALGEGAGPATEHAQRLPGAARSVLPVFAAAVRGGRRAGMGSERSGKSRGKGHGVLEMQIRPINRGGTLGSVADVNRQTHKYFLGAFQALIAARYPALASRYPKARARRRLTHAEVAG